MKRKKNMKRGALAGGLLLASAILTGCVRPGPATPVYGPAPDPDSNGSGFQAEDNIPQPVYGPGPDFDAEIDPEYDPEDNLSVPVYGPPPSMEDGETAPGEGAEVQP